MERPNAVSARAYGRGSAAGAGVPRPGDGGWRAAIAEAGTVRASAATAAANAIREFATLDETVGQAPRLPAIERYLDGRIGKQAH
jgi:hypothetical protein